MAGWAVLSRGGILADDRVVVEEQRDFVGCAMRHALLEEHGAQVVVDRVDGPVCIRSVDEHRSGGPTRRVVDTVETRRTD